MDFGRALHRGQHAVGSVSQREQLSAQGQEEFASAGRSGNLPVNFRGEKRSNLTHESKTDPDALRARKGADKKTKLSCSENLPVENRNGLIVSSTVWEATAERYAAIDEGFAG
jgi:hypothetical protein